MAIFSNVNLCLVLVIIASYLPINAYAGKVALIETPSVEIHA